MQDDSDPAVTPRPRAGPRRINTVAMFADRRNWPAWPVPIVCVVVFAGQMAGLVPTGEWAFSPAAFEQGQWWSPLTANFLHANSMAFGSLHLASNMWAYINLAPLVAARFGKGWRGAVSYHVFYLLCGLAGMGFFGLMHPGSAIPVVGASGAIYGVYAAMMRLDLFSERLRPIFSRASLEAVSVLIWSNLLVLVMFGGPLIVLQILAGQGAQLVVPIAWEAHVGGFVAGFLLIGLMRGRGWDGEWKAGLRLIRVEQRQV